MGIISTVKEIKPFTEPDGTTFALIIAVFSDFVFFPAIIGIIIPVVGYVLITFAVLGHYIAAFAMFMFLYPYIKGILGKLVLILGVLLPLPTLVLGLFLAILLQNKLVQKLAIVGIIIATGGAGAVAEGAAAEGAAAEGAAAEGAATAVEAGAATAAASTSEAGALGAGQATEAASKEPLSRKIGKKIKEAAEEDLERQEEEEEEEEEEEDFEELEAKYFGMPETPLRGLEREFFDEDPDKINLDEDNNEIDLRDAT